MDVDGVASTGYEVVRETVANCGPGVAVAAFVDGQPVIDLWTTDLLRPIARVHLVDREAGHRRLLAPPDRTRAHRPR